MAEKKIPQIRHSRFDNEWETTKLGNIANRVTRKNSNMESTLPLTISAQYGLVDQSLFFNSQIASQNISNYYLLINGEFAYNKSTSQDYPVGAVKRLDRYDMGVLSTLYILFKPTEEISSDYLVTYFDADYWHKEIKLRAAEGARNHGLLNISPDDFFDIDLNLPKDIDEQQAIGTFLQKVDLFVSQRRDKLEKLQNLKSSMLEKMFPKDGSVVPEVRFKGFEKPWQTIYLGDIASEITRTDKTSEAPIMMITAANGFIDQSDRYSFNNAGQSLAKYIVLKKGELAYNHGASKLRPYGSCFALNVDEARIPYVYHCFTISDHNPYFVSRVLNNKETEKQLRKLVTSGARMDGLLNISYEEYTTVNIQLPERDEQDRIADYFRNLETLIVLCQQELDKLQSLKKALLEKMFV